MRHVGIIGLGLLGGAVAGRLLKAGIAVTGYDVRHDAVEPLARQGLTPATDVAATVRNVDAVFVILPSLDSVDRVVRGPNGVLDSTKPETVVLQMSTISPPLTRALGEAASARGIGFLDTPMSGTASMVAKGDCTIFVGGDAALAERCRPVFEAIAKRFVHVGAVGDACLAKLATNLLVGLNTVAVAEALVLGTKGGLDPGRLLDVLRQSAAGSRMLEVRGPLMVERRFEPQMKSELFLKDFHLMLEEGRRLGVALPLTGLAEQLCTATVAAGRGGEDIAVIITTIERLAGMGA
ncbi:MAG: NAD(P)-dependent oxidoreductase [Candidatus Rokuibacteriota bacterium]